MWLQKLPAGVSSLTFSADGQLLYVLDTRGEITAWHTAARTPQRVHRIKGDVRLPDTALWTACDGRFLVVRLRSVVHIWDVAAGAEHAPLPLEPNGYLPSLDPTRRLLVMLDSQRSELTTWDIATQTPGPPLLRADPAAVDRFGTFGMSADGNTVAVSTARREVVLYDRPTNRVFARFGMFPAVGLVLQLAFSADGKTLAMLNLSSITLWDVPSQTIREKRIWCSMPIHLWTVHPTLPIIATRNSSGHITLFSLDTAEPIRSFDFTMGTSALRCVCFSPGGLMCAVGGSNKQFAVFDVDV
jgi:WD40 repeat protein